MSISTNGFGHPAQTRASPESYPSPQSPGYSAKLGSYITLPSTAYASHHLQSSSTTLVSNANEQTYQTASPEQQHFPNSYPLTQSLQQSQYNSYTTPTYKADILPPIRTRDNDDTVSYPYSPHRQSGVPRSYNPPRATASFDNYRSLNDSNSIPSFSTIDSFLNSSHSLSSSGNAPVSSPTSSRHHQYGSYGNASQFASGSAGGGYQDTA